MVIHKYPIPLLKNAVTFPGRHFRVLQAGLDPQGTLCVWALVDPDADEMYERTIYVVGTGCKVPEEINIDTLDNESGKASYLGTVRADYYMWHVFITME